MQAFDDRDGFIWVDGHMVPWREAKIHVLTHSLHYASSVYEGMRAYSGRIFKLREHVQRLHQSAHILGYELPYSTEELEKVCEDLVVLSHSPDCYIRPFAWRGTEVMGLSARQSKIHVAVAVWEWPSYFSVKKGSGLRLMTATWRRPSPACAPIRSKAAGLYTVSTLAKHAAEDAGFHDCLMLSLEGNVCEASGANIFFVFDNKLHTPIPDCFLDGITRQTVIALAKKRGIEVIERTIHPSEIKNADEIFLTGTAAEVVAVEAIDDVSFSPGHITEMLRTDYFNLVQGI